MEMLLGLVRMHYIQLYQVFWVHTPYRSLESNLCGKFAMQFMPVMILPSRCFRVAGPVPTRLANWSATPADTNPGRCECAWDIGLAARCGQSGSTIDSELSSASTTSAIRSPVRSSVVSHQYGRQTQPPATNAKLIFSARSPSGEHCAANPNRRMGRGDKHPPPASGGSSLR